jgi:hypothetical protein
LIFDVYAPLSIAAVVSVSLVGLSWAMEPSELSPSWNRSSESSSTATGIVRLAIELGGRHQIGLRSGQASPEAEPSAGTITVVMRRVVPGVQAWRACSMLIAAEIQRSLTGNRQAWSSAERELMPH